MIYSIKDLIKKAKDKESRCRAKETREYERKMKRFNKTWDKYSSELESMEYDDLKCALSYAKNRNDYAPVVAVGVFLITFLVMYVIFRIGALNNYTVALAIAIICLACLFIVLDFRNNDAIIYVIKKEIDNRNRQECGFSCEII